MSRFFVGITGASGHVYAQGVVAELVRAGHEVDLSITSAGCRVLRHELGVEAGERGERLASSLPGWLGEEIAAAVRVFHSDDIGAPPASGTALTRAVAIVPCSMGTLARITAGFSSNLVERAADVALKEGRTLMVMPRETPLSELHLENLLRLARMGAVILPCAPGFYHRPKTLDDLVAHLVGKALDRLGVEHAVVERWTGEDEPPPEPGIEMLKGGPGGDQE